MVIGLVFILMLAAYDIFGRPQKHKYPYPALFCLLSYGIYAASYAPEIFAGASVSGGVGNVNYQMLLAMVLANGIYLLGYLKRVLGDRGRMVSNPRFIVAGALICLALAGVFYKEAFDTVLYHSYSVIKTGKAAEYKQISDMRTRILLDEAIRDVILPVGGVDCKPIIQTYWVETNPEAWTNRALRDFYGKESVTGIDRDEWVRLYGEW